MTQPSNWRSTQSLQSLLVKNNLIGICGLDTRALTHRIRDIGAPNGVIAHHAKGEFDIDALIKKAKDWAGLDGMDLVPEVTCKKIYSWDQAAWSIDKGYATQKSAHFHVVAIDYGAKLNILRCLAHSGCKVTVVPATTSAADIFALKPDGVFLSNGPGDPAATGVYAVPVIKKIIESGLPLFGICLGHQLLSIALGAKTTKMARGHRGANHPVKDLTTGKVEITSQNHGFCVMPETLPENAEVTHVSLFDDSNEGVRLKNQPVFSVQYHPEASPGPQDSHYLFERFADFMRQRQSKAA
jgi:carbamoyl-phosphate synthase small subunit